jgi:hypothetical protein
VPNGNTGLSDAGSSPALALFSQPERAPGTIPDTVNPPHGPVTAPQEPLIASSTVPASSSTRVASAAPAAQSGESEGFFSSLARKVGLSSASTDTTATTTPQPATTPAKPKVADAKPKKTDTKQASSKPALKPTDTAADAPAPAAPPATSNSVVAGAQPVVPANSFENRFSAAK